MIKRSEELAQEFNQILEEHLQKIVDGKEENYLEIHEIARMMHVHPIHLSNTLKEFTGKAPCDICNEKTIKIAKNLLQNSHLSIAEIARKLTFDPSNFTKYFKKHTGFTPSNFRLQMVVEKEF